MADDCAAYRSSFVNNHELTYGDEACEAAALPLVSATVIEAGMDGTTH